MFLLIVLSLHLLSLVYGASSDIDPFNCPHQCGKMAEADESYQSLCTAFEDNCRNQGGEDYGEGSEDYEDKIVGGEEVHHHIPWLVLLVFSTSDKMNQIKCGGSLINDRYRNRISRLGPYLKILLLMS